MSTNKRRKLNVAEPQQAVSAFALRKKLLNQQTTPTPTEETNDEGIKIASSPSKPSQNKKIKDQKKSRKNPSTQTATGHEKGSSTPLRDLLPVELPTENCAVPNSSDALARNSSPLTTDDGDEVPVQPVKFLAAQLSSFKPTKSNYQMRKDGRVVLKLSDGDRLVILGSYGIRVTSGEITINGATLRSTEKACWVEAPHCHALPVIRCSDRATTELLPHQNAVAMKSLGKLSPYFRRLWNEPDLSSLAKKTSRTENTYQILYTSADGPKKTFIQDLVSPPEWNRELARLVSMSSSKPCSVMITGPKSSGKSTLGKILANRLITDQIRGSKPQAHCGVAVLDFDPGQPEYCVAGQVALVLLTEPVISPSFCRPLPSSEIQIIRSHALASTSPASDPDLYLEAAMDLMTHYRNTLGRCPLIINTPGWIQGTGLDLLTSLITNLRPTEVIYMSEYGPGEVVEALQESCKVSGFSTLPSQASQLTSRTAAHFRSMQTMAYFHAEPGSTSDVDRHIQWNTKPLTTIPPWQVSYIGPSRGIFGIMCYDYQAPLDLLADAINGTIVAIIGVENAKAFRHTTEHENSSNDARINMMDIDDNDAQKSMSSFSSLSEKIIATTPEGIPFIDTTNVIALDPRFSHSLGLALVRGIDVENGTLQLLTPLSLESIEEVASKGGEIVLISGKFDTPSWAYTEDLYYQTYGKADDGPDADEPMDATEENVDNTSDAENGDIGVTDTAPVPWIEVLHGNQKRGAGSKVWRVRRDLGRGNAT
ncbi:uncharacterized protein GGS22DRAFT_118094 [Annulohypoxylon maeteangense]|uniref:uncharacterized protein n=1 Tax=Annulohypoxylon maeteangense TaxID=1927788 RepID=UPI0020083CA1|nr:uncharacterized protein GGS22DRAFT_118094 [Annulohypoxylon maeteangense]KAI0886816.1 hypothetical protein GGS22DRAFT_118094 [Annulohypoxylon maeteangense]